MTEWPLIEADEELQDGGIELSQAIEVSPLELRNNPALHELDTYLDLPLVLWRTDAGRYEYHAVVTVHLQEWPVEDGLTPRLDHNRFEIVRAQITGDTAAVQVEPYHRLNGVLRRLGSRGICERIVG